jgi:hypothetical protein
MEILPENGLAEAVLSLGHLVPLTLQCTISSSGSTQERCLRSTIVHRFARSRVEDRSCYGCSDTHCAYSVRSEFECRSDMSWTAHVAFVEHLQTAKRGSQKLDPVTYHNMYGFYFCASNF